MPLSDFDYSEMVGQVKHVVFGILSPERIKQKAVCEIYKHVTNTKNYEGTLMDPRMGPIERGLKCPTCQYTYVDCPGHFGYMRLAKPVIQVQFYQMIIKLLGFFCNRCSSLLFDKSNEILLHDLLSKVGKGRLAFVEEKRKAVHWCPKCSAEQPKFSKDKEGFIQITACYEKDKKCVTPVIIDPEIIHTIFKNISDEDVELIGFNPKLSRPEWMIWTIMPIPPPAMRPTVKNDGGKIQEDDLTNKLNSIIKVNNQLFMTLGNPDDSQYVEKYWQILQYHVATYIDNEISSLPRAQQRSGRPLKTIRQRIKAKEGRIRGNLMGKRVDGSARSVITAEPCISMDQLGVPRKIAMNLTYPELVTEYNISQMTELIRRGPDVYPGAKSFKKKHEQRKTLKDIVNRDKIQLQPGDIVYRHLLDNDWVLFNRQPSLHKMSMMAHRVKVLDGKTFRLNINVCAPYNG